MKQDKLLHAAVCFIISFMINLVMVQVWPGPLAAMALGYWKESYDKTHGGKFDRMDLVADAIGAVAGAIVWVVWKTWMQPGIELGGL